MTRIRRCVALPREGASMNRVTPSEEADRRYAAPRRQHTRGANGRDAILTAALERFYEFGYHGTSIRDIAQSAGMTAPSLYHHFAGKQDILRTVMQAILREELSTTRNALVRAPP